VTGPARVVRILAPNPGPFTLEGTNTWVVGSAPSLVVDPGPDHPAHLEAVREQAGSIRAILLTHRHPDHAEGAARLSAASGAPVRSFAPSSGAGSISDAEVVEGGGIALRAIHTPGHAPDHLVFLEPLGPALFTGDAVLGRGTSVLDPPEGDVAAYLRSLRAMLALRPALLYPGHGPVVEDAMGKLNEYLEHRELRERQVLAGLRGDPRTPVELTRVIYDDIPPEMHPVAARSVLAHLLKLEAEGKVRRVGGSNDDRFVLAAR
jgi:glyoxylase-like metal-dependent hydrolase (beta-lactamase superfamily II)